PGMIPNAFDYQRASSLDEALGLVGTPGTKMIAGGMSLLPLMKLRLANPDKLVDIGRLKELKGVRRLPDGRLAIGALTTYSELLVASPRVRPDPRRVAGDRRRAGPQPRDRWRRDRPQRSGVRPARGPPRGRGRD